MKKIAGLMFVLVLLAASVSAAGTYPQLTGVWEGKTIGYNPAKGVVENTLTLDIKEQKDGVFHGVKTVKLVVSGKEMEEAFCGTVTPEGKILVSEFVDGYLIGTVKGETMVLQYAEAGSKAKAFLHELKRK